MSSRSTPKSQARGGKKQATRERVAEMRREQEQRDRRQRRLITIVSAIVVLAVVGAAVWAVTNERNGASADAGLPSVDAEGRTSPPPWSLPADPVPLAENAGLRVAPMEGTALHFHSHLDILVDGEPVTVPANIGIDPSGRGMSELHTHDERGVLHVEAPSADARYTLGQVFAQWDVRLDENGIGGLEVDDADALRAYVDGDLVEDDPADIELTEHRQIALVYGPPDADIDVPDSFEFNPGE